jgi:hypothetical protein
MDQQRIIRLMDYVKEVPDPRRARGKRYEWFFLLAVICAALSSGQKTVWAIVEWAVQHACEILELLQVKRHRMPSPATFYRAVRQVDIEALERKLAEYGQVVDEAERVNGSVTLRTGERVRGQALDGKEVRGANAHGEKVHLVSLVRHDSGVTLGQQRVADKTNEIRAAPELLKGRDLAGTVTTMDALLTQRSLAQQILDQHGDYLMIVKQNQAGMWEAIEVLFQSAPLPHGEDDRLH